MPLGGAARGLAAAAAAACSAVSVGVVPTVEAGEDPAADAGDPQVVGAGAGAAAGEDQGRVEDRHVAHGLGGAGGGDVGDRLGVGVARSAAPRSRRRTAPAPYSSMNAAGVARPGAAGEVAEEPGDVVLAADPAGVGLVAQPVDAVLQRRDPGLHLTAPRLRRRRCPGGSAPRSRRRPGSPASVSSSAPWIGGLAPGRHQRRARPPAGATHHRAARASSGQAGRTEARGGRVHGHAMVGSASSRSQ